MHSPIRSLIVNHIALPVDASFQEAFSVAEQRLRKIGMFPRDAVFRLFRRSVDARKKPDIRFVYSVAVIGSCPQDRPMPQGADFSPLPEEAPLPKPGG